MRLLLTLVAVAMLTVAVGCGPAEDAGTAAKSDTSSSGTPTAETSTETSETTTADTGEMTLVSLNLPGMT